MADTAIGPVLLGLVLVAGAAGFALWPLWHRPGASALVIPAGPTPGERFELYRQVLELEFDEQTGKLAAEDGALLRAELLARASVSLRAERADLTRLDEALEQEIAAARRALAGHPSGVVERAIR